MKALGDAGVPVPKMLILHEENDVVGTPFYLMDYIRGRIFKDAGLKDVPKEDRREVYNAVIEAIAKVHSVDPTKAGLETYGRCLKYTRYDIPHYSFPPKTTVYRGMEIKTRNKQTSLV